MHFKYLSEFSMPTFYSKSLIPCWSFIFSFLHNFIQYQVVYGCVLRHLDVEIADGDFQFIVCQVPPMYKCLFWYRQILLSTFTVEEKTKLMTYELMVRNCIPVTLQAKLSI